MNVNDSNTKSDPISGQMNDLDAARKRISELGDEKARLQGLYAGALNRIRVLEDEQKALQDGLKVLLSAMPEPEWFETWVDEKDAPKIIASLASAQALLGKGEPTIAEMSGLVEDFTGGVPLKEHLDALRGSVDAPSPTERPIQAGDTVRHKTKGWEKTVKRILPALPEKSLAVMALFDGGDRYPLSELERVEPAKVKP